MFLTDMPLSYTCAYLLHLVHWCYRSVHVCFRFILRDAVWIVVSADGDLSLIYSETYFREMAYLWHHVLQVQINTI
jgi:hypothetical protein